jgi:hypothetical protein
MIFALLGCPGLFKELAKASERKPRSFIFIVGVITALSVGHDPCSQRGLLIDGKEIVWNL